MILDILMWGVAKGVGTTVLKSDTVFSFAYQLKSVYFVIILVYKLLLYFIS